MTGGLYSLDGKTMLREVVKGSLNNAEKIGERLAEKILKMGGDSILKAIKGY